MMTVTAWLLAGLMMQAASPSLGTAIAGQSIDYCTAAGDSLDLLAARYGVDAAAIASRNGLARKARLAPGTILRIDAVHVVPPSDRTVVVNVPQRMLFVTAPDGVRAFAIAVGSRGWPTPLGTFTVTMKEEDPTWDVPVSIQTEMRRTGKRVVERVPPSPDNPLGKYWLGLSLPGIGIHGTNVPLSIHRFQTHGCLRVHPDLIGELFALVPEGAEGEILYEPLLLAVVDGRVYVEANPDAYGRAPVTMVRLSALAEAAAATERIDWSLAAEVIRSQHGIAVDVSVRRPH